MTMEKINSRKNARIRHLRRLGREREYRRETGLFLCDGEKLLDEAIRNGAAVREILYREKDSAPAVPGEAAAYSAPDEVFDYVSPLMNSPGPLFSAEMPALDLSRTPERVIVLENVRDPGNVGTVLRTAAALGIDLVILAGECADPFNPKTVRGAMGALFRQPFAEMDLESLARQTREWGLPLYGAALAADSLDIRDVPLGRAAVAVGNEGRGLTREISEVCDKKIVIPMTPGSESLNAAVAASVIMWEMAKEML